MGNNNDRLIRNRKPLVQKSAEKKARKVKFYRNGDRFFKGVTLAVSAERYRTFDALVCELNRLVGDRVNLHQGVRVLFTLDGNKISTVDELQVRIFSYKFVSEIDFQIEKFFKWKETLSEVINAIVAWWTKECRILERVQNWKWKGPLIEAHRHVASILDASPSSCTRMNVNCDWLKLQSISNLIVFHEVEILFLNRLIWIILKFKDLED